MIIVEVIERMHELTDAQLEDLIHYAQEELRKRSLSERERNEERDEEMAQFVSLLETDK